MIVYIVTFIAVFCGFVGMISYLNNTKIRLCDCLIGISLGIAFSALIGVCV